MTRRTTFGRAALLELREAVAEAKTADPMAPVTVIVPSNVAGITARRFLAGGLSDESNGVAGIWFTTLTRLAEQLATPTLHASGRRPLTDAVLAAEIRGELDARPGLFEAVREHPATAQAIATAHRELRETDDDALDAIATTSTLSRDVVRIHRALRSRLSTSWYDATDLLIEATRAIEAGPDLVRERGRLIAYLPPDHPRRAQRFLDTLTRATDAVTITADATVGPTTPTATAVITASDSDDEVRCVVRAVSEDLHRTPAHRVGVLYSDRSPYSRLLHEHLAQAGIAVNGAGVRPVIERALPRFALGLLETARTGWRRGDLLRVLGEVPIRDAAGRRIPVARWERMTREAGVVSGHDWSVRLEHQADTFRQAATAVQVTTERAEWLLADAETIDALRQFITGLIGQVDAVAQATTWAAAATGLTELLDQLVPDESRERMPLEEHYAAAQLTAAIGSLATLDGGPARPSLAGVRETLLLSLDGGLPRVGRFGTGVYVAPLTEAPGQDLDVVYLVGLSEDLYPGRLPADSLLPERVRERSLGQLPSLRDRVTDLERAMSAGLHSAPRIVVSFARGDLRRHTNRLPSRWVLPTLRHLSGDPGLPATEYARATGDWLQQSASYAGSIAAADPVTDQEWRQRAVLAGDSSDDPVLRRAEITHVSRLGAEFSPYDGNLAGTGGLPVLRTGERTIAPTALERYAVCPHGWFVRDLLRVSPQEEPGEIVEVSAADVGDIVHQSFDRWIKDAGERGELPSYGEPWTGHQRIALQDVAEQVAAEYEAVGRTGHVSLWARRKALILQSLDRMVTEDNRWRAERDARVVGSELSFGGPGQEPVLIEIDGGAVAFRGSIDKVDETRDGTLLVTDIKTGSSRTFKGLSEEDPVKNGAKLQLPLYAHAARQLLGRPDAPAEAYYWFVHREWDRIMVPLTEPVVASYRDTVGGLVAAIERGSFPQRAPDIPHFLWVTCSYCNPDGLGHEVPRRRWEQMRTHPDLTAYTAIVEPDALVPADTPVVDGEDGS